MSDTEKLIFLKVKYYIKQEYSENILILILYFYLRKKPR